jgi:uncharacterized protein related to proFAR isomerase
MNYLLGIIALLGGLVLYYFQKLKSSEALLSNTETKEKVLELEKTVMEETAKIDVNKEKLEEEKKKDIAIEELRDFFGRNLNDK